MSVEVSAHSRIHMGLLDLANASHRAYGGLGFFLEDPTSKIEVERSDESNLVADQLTERDYQDLSSAITRWEDMTGGKSICVEVKDVPPQHVGLGTKTGMILGIYFGARECYGVDLTNQKLQKLSGRGGVSGIGINGFFRGGFIVDGGQPQSSVKEYSPSSFSSPDELPPLITSCPFPEDWKINLYLPEGNTFQGESEHDVFRRKTPISKKEAHHAISLAYHGIASSIIGNDLETLATALKQFHEIGFKKREVEEQTEEVRALLHSLQQQDGIAAGMSSVGPLIYAIEASSPEGPISSNEIEPLVTTMGHNEGAEIWRG